MTLMSEIRVTLKDQISLPSDSSTQRSGEVFFIIIMSFAQWNCVTEKDLATHPD